MNNDNHYKGMSDEAAKEYEKRQNEPLFKSAKEMIPIEQVRQHFENLICGYNKRYGCQLLVRDTSFYCCIYHQAMQAVGTDFMMYYRLINDNDLDRMTAQQHNLLEKRRTYMTKWLDNFPRGA